MKSFSGAIKITLSVIMILCVSIFTVLSDIIKPDINPNVYTSGYWLEVLIINGSVISVVFLIKSIRVDNGKKKNKKYRILDGTLDMAFREINKNGAANDFLTYISEDNKNAKKLAYETYLFNKKGKIVEKIQKAKAKINNKRLLQGLNILEEPNTNKLIKLRSKLAFIEERVKKMDEELPFIKVKYIKITLKSIFGRGVDFTKSERDTSSHEGLFNLFIFLKRALLILALGLFALLSAKQVKFEMSMMFFFTIALRIFQIALGVYSGLAEGDTFVSVNLCDAFMQRVFYLQGYFDKAKGVQKTVTAAEIDLQEITKRVTANVTEELDIYKGN